MISPQKSSKSTPPPLYIYMRGTHLKTYLLAFTSYAFDLSPYFRFW